MALRSRSLILCFLHNCRPEEEGQQPGRARRKTQQALAYEVLVHFTIQIRAFYTAVAKAIQTPVRRREELGTAPTMAMRAAAINMAVVLRENMRYKILPVSAISTFSMASMSNRDCRIFVVSCDWERLHGKSFCLTLESCAISIAVMLQENMRYKMLPVSTIFMLSMATS